MLDGDLLFPSVVSMPAGMRAAGPDDVVPVFDFLSLLHAENGMAKLSAPKVLAAVRHATDGKGGLIGVLDGPDGIEASIGLTIGRWWYTDQCHLEELWCFVHPEHRHGGHHHKLIEFGIWAATAMKLPILLGVLTKERVDAKVRLYRQMLPQVGGLFLYEPSVMVRGGG